MASSNAVAENCVVYRCRKCGLVYQDENRANNCKKREELLQQMMLLWNGALYLINGEKIIATHDFVRHSGKHVCGQGIRFYQKDSNNYFEIHDTEIKEIHPLNEISITDAVLYYGWKPCFLHCWRTRATKEELEEYYNALLILGKEEIGKLLDYLGYSKGRFTK